MLARKLMQIINVVWRVSAIDPHRVGCFNARNVPLDTAPIAPTPILSRDRWLRESRPLVTIAESQAQALGYGDAFATITASFSNAGSALLLKNRKCGEGEV